MRKWLLLALLGLILLFVVSRREGADETLAPAPTCMPETMFDGVNCIDANNIATPRTCPSGFKVSGDKCTPLDQNVKPSDTNYSDILSNTQDANNGALPPPIDESAYTDSPATRPMNGPVFDYNGPFSGEAGTGQGTGMNAAATLNGSTYGTDRSPDGTLTPYSLWPGTKGTRHAAPPSSKVPVKGPNWGGPGEPSSGSASQSSRPAPVLYGPGAGDGSGAGGAGGGGSGGNMGWGYSQKNSRDTSGLPGYSTTGSDPSNGYAATSRRPGDLDSMPNTNLQSSSYSLANGSQKTDPVPYLADFSAFQS